MKKLNLLSTIVFFSILLLLVTSCKKDDDDTPTPPQYDHSLILSRGSGAKLVLTNPVDGKDLHVSVPSPAVEDVKSLQAGYMCQNAVFVAKTNLKDYTMSLYTCDAKTGAGTKTITEDDLYVYEGIDVSPAGPKIVFCGKDNNNPEYQSVYTISEDGTGLTHLSQPLEPVTGLNGGQYELQPTSYPAFSPNGSKIAFDALVLTLPDHNDFYEFIMIMNANGTNKETVFSEPGQHIEIYDICWTQDGNFLLFVMLDNDDNFHRRVYALNMGSKNVTDITSSLEVNGDQVYHICTSPNSNRLVFNQHLGGGSDLFLAEYEIHDDVLTIKGSPSKLTDKQSSGMSYYTPSWQLWDEQ